jgi:hypothetical protein
MSTAREERDARNRATERAEIEHLKTGPERAFLYVRHVPDAWAKHHSPCQIITWMGTVLDARAEMGPRVPIGSMAVFVAYKRAVRCVLFGRAYYGWYYESSGEYCRLKRSAVREVAA